MLDMTSPKKGLVGIVRAKPQKRTWFNSYLIVDFKGLDLISNLVDSPRNFVAHYQGLLNFSPNSTTCPEMNL
jgi:hypothetical protein